MADWRGALMSAVVYRDPKAALKFLEAAFGFELFMLIEDGEGNLVHSEMRFGNAAIMVGYEWSDDYRSPASIGGKVTQSVAIGIDTDIRAHCERARAAGMEILAEPELQFYGDSTYRCRDPEGHIWTVSQAVQAVSREEAEAATGLKITGWV
ncbi:MAG: VOC family protein [Phenylobacterium sp.]|uniref:VOC family protein n=1 Tax=Phenylobacterium sp. TaxID=1871053 RepID=UPI001A4AC718|nr:VOC family protein [Phenylobacterium sp.]MBL8553191.1 VOC family protein [Phenylobacterium sp.]